MTGRHTERPDPAYLLAYDIRDPRRLRRVHRFLSRHMYRLQYSVFVGPLSRHGRATVMDGVARRIDARADDVRLYRLPHNVWADGMGKAALPAGLQPGDDNVARLLRMSREPGPDPDSDERQDRDRPPDQGGPP